MGAVIPTLDEGSDFRIEVLDRGEDSASDGLAFDDAESDFYEVHPRSVGRCEIDRKPGIVGQPRLDFRVLVSGVVGHHQV